MKKRIFVSLSTLLCIAMLLTSCKGGGNGGNGGTKGTAMDERPFNVPENIMTTEEYHAEIKKLLSEDNFTTATDEKLKQIDTLGDKLKESIIYNTDDITECTGTTYYVSNDGNDENDGKTPETAWATLDKITDYQYFNPGDLVLFKRGDVFRGHFNFAGDGVTFSAYGEGHKPRLLCAQDGMSGEWEKVEGYENIWSYQMDATIKDVCSIVFNDGESYADKKHLISELKKPNQFTYYAPINSKASKNEYKVYLYCEGNPQKVYKQIEISLPYRVINVNYGKNLHFNNLELLYGLSPLSGNWNNGITLTYCVGGWSGGAWVSGNIDVRYYGGLGEWEWANDTLYDHCYIYQQFDSGVTPQYAGGNKNAVIKNYATKNCLFENCEYTLEYFMDCPTVTDERFEELYFGYNFCRLGGYGFGDKAAKSAYVKSWAHENNCYNSTIEYNIFDRPFGVSINVNAFEQGQKGKTPAYNLMPKLQNNVYIHKQNKQWANIGKKDYLFTEESYNALNDLGIELGSRFIFVDKNK